MTYNKKNVNAILNETAEVFESNGVSIIGEGFKEIATNRALLESYIDSLTQGFANPDASLQVAQIMQNTNRGILNESMGGIAPIAGLSMPTIRKLWPKFAIKEAIKTEVTTKPRFIVSYMKPYLFRANANGEEERVDLPIKSFEGNPLTRQGGRVTKQLVPLIAGTGVVAGTTDSGVVTVTGGNGVVNAKFDTKVAQSGSNIKVQPLSTEVKVVAVTHGGKKIAKIPVHRLDVTNSLVLELAYEADTTATPAITAGVGQLIIRVDLVKATALVIAAGFQADLAVTLEGYRSEEYNEATWSVNTDVARHDIEVPDGIQINAPLNIQQLNDSMAMYEIDGVAEVTDIMTNTFAQNLDYELLDFLYASHEGQPGLTEFADYPGYREYELSFNVAPAAGFAGSPKEWREELKPMIDHLATKIKANTYLSAGVFSIVGHPLDIQLITNIDWAFRGGQGSGVDGVDVDYAQGTYIGANAYRIISSPNAEQGRLVIVFTPSTNKQMTYKYYPYTFSVERGYTDPNRSRVPSIMMVKRHTYAEFLPAIGIVNIVGNNGTGQFNTGTVWTNTTWS